MQSLHKKKKLPAECWDCAVNYAVSAQNNEIMQKMKTLFTKYWDCAKNYGVTAQNVDFMQKIMQLPHKIKKLRTKYWDNAQNGVTGKITRSCRKWCTQNIEIAMIP